jgi:GntP family gluconate:H+ symporter
MKLNPLASMFFGAIIGAFVGGASINQVLHNVVVSGGMSVMLVCARILACGILAGVLIETGAAETIARSIVKTLGEKAAILSLALAAMVILAVGVFIPISVLILAPIALSVAKRTNMSKYAAILALSGGAKAGNIISPNPNAVTAADVFQIELSQVMMGGIAPAIVTLGVTVLVANKKKNRGPMVQDDDIEVDERTVTLPPFRKAFVAPFLALFLLFVTPLDPFFALPIGAVAGIIVMGKWRETISLANAGITRMMPIVLMLIGAGALGQLIQQSYFPQIVADGLYNVGIPTLFLAPVSGAIMGSATGSAAIGVILASNAFVDTLLAAGIPALASAVMIHAGVMLMDVVPHGNYFLASQQGMKVTMIERIKVMPYDAICGFALVGSATLFHGFIFPMIFS